MDRNKYRTRVSDVGSNPANVAAAGSRGHMFDLAMFNIATRFCLRRVRERTGGSLLNARRSLGPHLVASRLTNDTEDTRRSRHNTSEGDKI